LAALTLATGLGCRRSPLKKGGAIDAGGTVIDAGADVRLDVAPAGDAADAPTTSDAADAPTTSDAADAPTTNDASDAADAVDAGTVQPLPCGALRTLSSVGPFTPHHAKRVLFSPDRRLLVLQANPPAPDGGTPAPTDDLLLVRLPIGPLELLMSGLRGVEWLGTSGNLLATLPGNDLAVVPTDGRGPRVIARTTCVHLAAPDGSRVFVVRDCTSTGSGVLDEIDVASGVATTRAPLVARDASLAISPSGRFAAYVTARAPDAVTPDPGMLHVLDRDFDRDQAIAPAPAHSPFFASDQRLLFMNPTSSLGDTYVHVPGAGDTSQRIAQNRHLGYNGYRISPDRSLLLAAVWTNMFPWANPLYAVRLDGSGEQLLTDNLYAYQMNQIAVTPFAFSADGRRVIYVGPQDSNGGISAAAVDGSTDTKIADGYGFVVSRFADRVAAIDIIAMRDQYTVRVVASATGAESFKFPTNSGTLIRAPTFVPDDRGLLYVEAPTTGTGPTALNHLSFVDGRITPIGRWTRSQLPVLGYPIGELGPGYPAVDPTGCFAIVDSDLPESPGTSLVVLPDEPE
jgi:hypothetical protein